MAQQRLPNTIRDVSPQGHQTKALFSFKTQDSSSHTARCRHPQLSKHYRTGRLTPDAVAAHCERHAERLAALNIFTHREPALTRRQAAAATERYASGSALGLLDGVPVAIKDNFCVADLPTTCASK